MKENPVWKVDDFWSNLIWETIYRFNRKNGSNCWQYLSETERCLLERVMNLYHLLKKLCFWYQKTDNWKVITEKPRTVAWMSKYLWKIWKFRAENYVIVYLDKTWSDSRATQEWFGETTQQNVPFQYHRLKEKRLSYAMLEVVKGLYQMLFYCVVSNFPNHMLIIMTWMLRFSKGGLQIRW